MKRVLIGIVVFTMMGGTAYAANQSNTGCGLGTLVLGDAGAFSDSTLGQSFIATTNGTSGNQTFGITSGTSNCDQPKAIVLNERLEEFVVANMDGIAKDIAAAEGESLDTLAELMDISPADRAETYAKLQSEFSTIYSSSDVTAAAVVDAIYGIIKA